MMQLLFSLFFIGIFFFPSSVFAKTSTPNLITVAPSILKLDLQTDLPTAEVYYKNDTSQTIALSLSAEDFTELEDGYKLSFLEKKDAANYKYRLSSWITFEKKTLVIAPHETEKVKLFINKEQLSPGGHYAAILAHLINEKENSDVTIHGILSSLLFVRTNTGHEIEAGKIDKLSPIQDWFAFPQSFVMRFQNTGNTEIIPFGTIQIQDFFGNTIAKGIVNEGSLDTLPESIRRYDIPVVQKSPVLLPGMYTATASLHFGKTNKTIQQSIHFFSDGTIPLFPIIFIIGALFSVIFFFKKRKKLKRN